MLRMAAAHADKINMCNTYFHGTMDMDSVVVLTTNIEYSRAKN